MESGVKLHINGLKLVVQSGVIEGYIVMINSSKEDIINEIYRSVVKFNKEVLYKDFYIKQSIQERFRRFWGNMDVVNYIR